MFAAAILSWPKIRAPRLSLVWPIGAFKFEGWKRRANNDIRIGGNLGCAEKRISANGPNLSPARMATFNDLAFLIERDAISGRLRQYVKICSLYGAGFFYIPGTDTCIKIGGYVRAEYDINAKGSFTVIANGANGTNTRESQNTNDRTRGLVTFDVRSQTQFGTL